MSPLQRYSVYVLAGAVGCILVTAALAVAIDPYAIWGTKRIAFLNAKKPAIYTHAVLAKVEQAKRAAPRTVVLGNSRMDVGIDPESRYWPSGAHPVFNLAIPGQGPSGDLRNLHTVFPGTEGPGLALLGVDFFDSLFDSATDATPPRSRSGSKDVLKRLGDLSRTTVSIDALMDALSTVLSQRDRHSVDMTTKGFNPFHQYARFVRIEGHNAIFQQRNVEYTRRIVRTARPTVATGEHYPPSFKALRAIIDWCRSRGVTLHLVIYPYHADLMETLRLTALWPAFEAWKRSLVDLVEQEKLEQRYDTISVWDFSGYHGPSIEPVPPSGDRLTDMQWYWEAGHFKAALGDELLRRIFSAPAAEDFGAKLDDTNIEAHLTKIRERADLYRQENPDSVARMQKIYEEVVLASAAGRRR